MKPITDNIETEPSVSQPFSQTHSLELNTPGEYVQLSKLLSMIRALQDRGIFPSGNIQNLKLLPSNAFNCDLPALVSAEATFENPVNKEEVYDYIRGSADMFGTHNVFQNGLPVEIEQVPMCVSKAFYRLLCPLEDCEPGPTYSLMNVALPPNMHQMRPLPAIVEQHLLVDNQVFEMDANVTPAGTFVDIHVGK